MPINGPVMGETLDAMVTKAGDEGCSEVVYWDLYSWQCFLV